MKHPQKDIKNLIQGIEVLLSMNRSSFSDEEKRLLSDIVTTLKEFQKPKKIIDPITIVRIAEIMIRIFGTNDWSSFF